MNVWPETVPFMAGAQEGDEFTFPGDTPAGGRNRPAPTGAINTTEQLKKHIRDYKNFTLMEIINNLQSQGRHLTPGLYKELQDKLVDVTTGIAETGSPGQVIPLGTTRTELQQAVNTGRVTGGGGGGGTTRTAAQEEVDRAQAEYYRAQAADLAQQREIQRQAALETRRQNLLNAALRLTEAQLTERASSQKQGVELAGFDPFRFAGQLRGQSTPADVKTPYDIFKGTLQQRATAPLPNIGPNSSIEDLESALGKLQQMQSQSQQGLPSFGFAGGGVASTVGPFEARLVGEAGSRVAPGTEVMVTGNGQTMILPLEAGMQEGGVLGPGSLGVYPQLFENLRRRLISPGAGAEQTRANLGFLPEGSRLGELGGGYGGLAEPLSGPLRRGYGELVKLGKLTQADADFIVNSIGELPNPRQAAQWFRTLDPTEKEAVLSLYKLANVPQATFDALVASATLTGQRRTPVQIAA